MRALHTSDWHIGVKKHRVDRMQDHERVFAQIKEIAIDERVDLIINTGDLFDELNPSAETLLYGWSVLSDMAKIAPIVVLCGNHDSSKYFQVFDEISNGRLPIHFIYPAILKKGPVSIVQIPTRDGEIIKIGAVPFIKSQSYIRKYIDNDAERATAKYADEVGLLEHRVGTWLNDGYDVNRDIRIFAAHLLLDGAQISGSEYQVHVDSDFAIKSERIPLCDYAAFGHIHKPQQIAGIDHGRYAGSPIPIDFGEVTDQKLCYVLSGKPGYALDIEERLLDVGRKMVDIRGTLEEISRNRAQYANTIARVFVTLHAPMSDLESQVNDILGETIVCQVKGQYEHPEDIAAKATVLGPEPTLNEMFSTFLASDTNIADSARVQRYFDDLLHRVESNDVEDQSFPDIDEVIA